MKKDFHIIIFLLLTFGFSSCKKEFLEKKPISTKVIPSTLQDFQQLLDQTFIFNECPALGEISTDDYQINEVSYLSSPTNVYERNAYVWAKDIFPGVESVPDWNFPYQQVFYANVALEGVNKIGITNANQGQWNTIKGSALFLRAFAFFNLAQVFSPAYGGDADINPYGIPLRLTSGIDDATTRSTVKQTYDQIIMDLKQAINLLPEVFQLTNRNRPSKSAAEALLARVYLSMRDYQNAGLYANSSLAFYNKLIDYNSLSITASFPFDILNQEVLYQSNLLTTNQILTNIRINSGYKVEPSILQMYHGNDLRKLLFFSDVGRVKGSYASRTRFSGLATDELYLIRAECNARASKTTEAMKDLNDLLRTRWKKNPDGSTSYIDQTANNSQEALSKILLERRKELIFRGLRWIDLRRLNLEGQNITLSRAVNGVMYSLAPNDPRYVLPIPNDVINLTGIAQNPR
ncbi:hypothetical protein HDC92_002180 [Pedobacter sp. AK017]|uniref:RagB/SusD family nutrient uptake outer membrane protein n=1 Tax=Pedobacter sp. AK017 TaxID=2723073 RepID=UPI0016093FFE|nr:RagB/SusD family nutrient uptake outer membrane protein [Pedobacter sp. AK017]MBB5438504.1 hypothetical protein [Pedobacter sp. AK017]